MRFGGEAWSPRRRRPYIAPTPAPSPWGSRAARSPGSRLGPLARRGHAAPPDVFASQEVGRTRPDGVRIVDGLPGEPGEAVMNRVPPHVVADRMACPHIHSAIGTGAYWHEQPDANPSPRITLVACRPDCD